MIPSAKHIEFKYFPIALIIVYVPFHILEEAVFNFPLWMFTHYNLPKSLSYPHWLINNLFFFIGLLSGLFVFLKHKTKYLAFGIGIVIWGFMNSIEHIVFSISDYQVSPGLYTSIFFVLIATSGFINLHQNKLLSKILILKSIGIAVCYWIIPLLFIVSIGSVLVRIFP